MDTPYSQAKDGHEADMEPSDRERLVRLETQMAGHMDLMDEVRQGQAKIEETLKQLLIANSYQKGRWGGVAIVASGIGVLLSILKEVITHFWK